MPRTFFCLLVLFLTGWCQWGHAQGRISNVRLRSLDQQSVEIRYDLRNSRPTDSLYVRLQRRNGKFISPNATSLSGDLGTNQADGRDRRVVWNLRQNNLLLREEVRAVVLLKPTLPGNSGPAKTPPTHAPTDTPIATPAPPEPVAAGQEKPYRGPAWALLSVLAPGVGNIFVQTPRPRLGLRPLVTVAAYGLLIYGAGQQGEADQAYQAYETAGNEAAAEPFYQKANAAHQRYYVASRAAAAIWITDVTLTLIRGFRNQRADRQEAKPVSFHLNYQANTPVAVVRYSF